MEMILIHKILIVLINAIGVLLACFVYFSNPRAKINKLFVIMTISMFVWVNFALFARIVDEIQLSLILIKTAWFATTIFFALLYLLTIFLIQEEDRYRLLSKVVLFLAIIAAFITGFTDLTIQGIRFDNDILSFIYGKGIAPFLAIVFFIMVATLYPLFLKNILNFQKQRKRKSNIL